MASPCVDDEQTERTVATEKLGRRAPPQPAYGLRTVIATLEGCIASRGRGMYQAARGATGTRKRRH